MPANQATVVPSLISFCTRIISVLVVPAGGVGDLNLYQNQNKDNTSMSACEETPCTVYFTIHKHTNFDDRPTLTFTVQ